MLIYMAIREKKKAEIRSKYKSLMKLTDDELTIRNSNEWVLKENPVYNSDVASAIMKKCIKDRKLYGLSQEEFLDEYKRLMYGYRPSLDNIVEEEEGAFDFIPLSLDAELVSASGQREDYLLAICKEQNITYRELRELIDLKNQYKTNFPTLLRLREQHSIEDIANFLEVREEIGNLTGYRVSLNVLARFYSVFNFLDPIIIADLAEQFGINIEAIEETLLRIARVGEKYGVNWDVAATFLLDPEEVYETYFPDVCEEDNYKIPESLYRRDERGILIPRSDIE